MLRLFAIAIAALWLGVSGAMAEKVDGQETYSLLFRDGALNDIDRSAELHYRQTVTNRLQPEADTRDTGKVAIMFVDGGMARIEFRQDEKGRGLGRFPASVGNPMIMYFYEKVLRDMAQSAGGSPFYIRNRVKESLVRPSEVEPGEAVINGETVATKTIRLRPFEGDPNTARMRGFGDLELAPHRCACRLCLCLHADQWPNPRDVGPLRLFH